MHKNQKIIKIIKSSDHKNEWEKMYKIFNRNQKFINDKLILSKNFWNTFLDRGDFNKFAKQEKIKYIRSIFNKFFRHDESDFSLFFFYNIFEKNEKLFSNILSNIKYQDVMKLKFDESVNIINDIDDVESDQFYINKERIKRNKYNNNKNEEISRGSFSAFIGLLKTMNTKEVREITRTEDVFDLCCFNYCLLNKSTLDNYLNRGDRIFALVDFSKIDSKSVVFFTYNKNEVHQIREINDWNNKQIISHTSLYIRFIVEIDGLKLHNTKNNNHLFLENDINKKRKIIYKNIIKSKREEMTESEIINLELMFIKNRSLFDIIINKEALIMMINKSYIYEDKIFVDKLVTCYMEKFGLDKDIMLYMFRKKHILLIDNNLKVDCEIEMNIGEYSDVDFISHILKNNIKYRLNYDFIFKRGSMILTNFIEKLEYKPEALMDMDTQNLIRNIENKKIIKEELRKRNSLNLGEMLQNFIMKNKIPELFELLSKQGKTYDNHKEINKINANYTLFSNLVDNNNNVKIEDDIKLHNNIKEDFNEDEYKIFCNLYIVHRMRHRNICAEDLMSLIKMNKSHYESSIFFDIFKYYKGKSHKYQHVMEALKCGQPVSFITEILMNRDIVIKYSDIPLNISEKDFYTLIWTFKIDFSKDNIKDLHNISPLNLKVYAAILYSNLKQDKKDEAKYVYYYFQKNYRDKKILKEMEYWLNRFGVYL